MLSLLVAPVFAADVALGPGVLVDSDAQIAYVAVPHGGVDALNATTGKVIWHTDDIDVPLGGVAYLVVGWHDNADGVELVGIHPDGTRGTACSAIQLPPWANPRVDAVQGATTTVEVIVHVGGIDARWVAVAGEHEFEGSGWCDLKTGVWTAGPWLPEGGDAPSNVVIGAVTLSRDGGDLVATKASGKKRWRVPVRGLVLAGAVPS